MSAGLTTSDTSYYTPLRVKMSIMDNKASTTYYNYSSFFPFDGYTTGFTSGYEQVPSSLKLLQATVTLGVNQAGTFSYFVEDSGQVLDRTKIKVGNKVIISAGKTDAISYPLITGYVRNATVFRDDTGILYYQFNGYGSQIICNERIIDFQKLGARDTQGNPIASSTDQSTLAYNLFKTIFEGSSIIPLSSAPTLQQQGQFTENGIDTRVNTNIFGIVEPLVDASSVISKIVDGAGAIWGIRNDDIFLRYPTAIHSGVTLKNGVSATDLADKTSYFTAGYSYTESIDQANGFANRLWLKGGAIANNPSTSSTSKTSFTSLFNKDIAVQIIPSSAQLRSLALTLSLAGTGGAAGNQNQFLTGALIQDAGTGFPNGAKVADFSIPLSSIPTTPTSVFDLNYKWYVQTLQPNSAYWIVLYAKGTDDSNSVLWHNDGDITTENRFSATRQVTLDPTTEARTQFPLKNDTGGWAVSDTGPIYSHDFFENVRVLTEASDPGSMDQYGAGGGPCEAIIEVPWIVDNQSMQTFASAILQQTAKPVRQYTCQGVTIPNNMVFYPGTLIDINDPLGGLAPPKSLAAEIQQVTYSFTATGTSTGSSQNSAPTSGGTRLPHPLGTTTADLLLVSYVDFLSDSIS